MVHTYGKECRMLIAIIVIVRIRLNNIYAQFHLPSPKFDWLERVFWQPLIIFHYSKVRKKQNICVMEGKGELSSYEHLKKNGCGSGILSFIQESFPKLSVYSVTKWATDELNDSHLSASHILSFKILLFPTLHALTRLIV